MHTIVVGLNYKTAPVEIRERFAFSQEALTHAVQELRETKSILECVIVATCNRTEIYAVVDRVNVGAHYIRKFLEQTFSIPKEEFQQHLYIKEDREAFAHLFRVTSGLDSMVIGETQILGQVKEAFFLSQSLKATGTYFNTLFKQAVTMAKKAHAETGIADNPVSVSYAAVELGRHIFGQYTNKTVMIIGAGKMSELTVKHLHAGGVGQIYVVNRTFAKAAELAAKFGGIPVEVDQMVAKMIHTDIVISSTGSNEYVLTQSQVEQVMASRKKSQPLFMMDIAVPRDIDPAISEMPEVFLYDIDDLNSLVETHMEQRKKAASAIEERVQAEVEIFEQWIKMLGVSPVIHALQSKANSIHQETMASLMNKLPDLTEREKKTIHKLTKSIVNQMLRDPILRIKEMAAERDGNEALDLFTHIFALEDILEAEKDPGQSAAGVPRQDAKEEGKWKDELSRITLGRLEALART